MSVAVAEQTKSADGKHNLKAVREAYYDKIAKYDMAPLWEVLKNVVTKEPKSKCVPQVWKFSDVKRLMLEAGEVITADEAERRVLVLENPALHGQTRVTNSLFAGIQLIMPGEVAPAHRHVASAIRFVLDHPAVTGAIVGVRNEQEAQQIVRSAPWPTS